MRKPERQNDREDGALGNSACGAALAGKNDAHGLTITGKSQNAPLISPYQPFRGSSVLHFASSAGGRGKGGGARLHRGAPRLSLTPIVHARSPEAPMIKLRGIGHVQLRVADQEVSKRFYRDLL